MRVITYLLAASLSILLIAPAHASSTQWWSNRTSALNVFDAGPFEPEIGERPRLGLAMLGFIEGTVSLLSDDDWLLDFTVSYDGNVGADEMDFVRVFLDGVMIGDFTNDAVYPVSHAFTGSSIDYRFEFTSSNSDIGFHQIVNAGTITPAVVPLPAAVWLFVSALGVLGLKRELLSNLVFRKMNQAAAWLIAVTSIPSLNLIPITSFAR